MNLDITLNSLTPFVRLSWYQMVIETTHACNFERNNRISNFQQKLINISYLMNLPNLEKQIHSAALVMRWSRLLDMKKFEVFFAEPRSVERFCEI